MTTATELPEVNRELFRQIRDWIKTHPSSHDNWMWESSYGNPECGTTRCTAGWAIHFAYPGYRYIREALDHHGNGAGYSGFGRELLGLTYPEAEYLFYCDNEPAMEMIEHYAECGREGWELPDGYED